MGEHNKILDVTYGNFSCRLEGFDDSVETLKAVVSYFQDISTDDTFTLDAPKTPDIETLTRLAENHTDGVVEIESDGEHLSLRVQDADDVAVDGFEAEAMDNASSVDAPYIEDAMEDEDDNVFTDIAEDVADEVPDVEADASDAPDMADYDDAYDAPFAAQAPTPAEHAEQQASVADKLQRIRAVVGRGRPQEADDTYAEDLSDPAPAAAPAAANPLAQRLAELAKRNSELMDADALAEMPQMATSEPLQLDGDDLTDAHEDITEEIAVKGIAEAVSALSEDDLAPVDDVVEPVAEAEDAAAPMVLSRDLAVESDAPETELDAVDSSDEAIADEAPAPEVTEEVAAAGETVAEDEIAETEVTIAEDFAADDVEAAVMDDPIDAPEIEVADELVEADAEGDIDAAADIDAHDEATDIEMHDEVTEEEAVTEPADEEPMVAQDAVEVDAGDDAVAQDDTAEETDADEDVADAADDEAAYEAPASDEPVGTESRPLLLTPKNTSISEDDDEDDFDLQEEVAELTRELASRPGNELARHGLPRSVEDAMSRILMETNQHLDEPESKRHRDAFAQLKAAVASTEAARQLGDAAKSRDIGALFKDDFGALEAEETAKDAGGPSLKLVTDDDGADAPSSRPLDAASARLREIAALKEGDTEGNAPQNFASFAKAQSATELADLIEAAAAYISFVDGDTDFSRPQVMKVAQTATDGEITREDGLRSFGRLLRQSRLIKLNNGRFQVSDSTRFRPTSNRAARG